MRVNHIFITFHTITCTSFQYFFHGVQKVRNIRLVSVETTYVFIELSKKI